MVKLFLNSRTIPPEDMDAIRRWLVDENRMDEKADVFVRQFAANIAYSKRPRESGRLWVQFAQRIRVKNANEGNKKLKVES